MVNGLVNTAAQTETSTERRFYGVVIAQVTNNIDTTGQGRVQVHFPWLPEIEPWARVAVPMAGSERGTYFIPQVDDEVLVAFDHGDVRNPYIVGSLWNGQDSPPATAPTDAVNKRVIRTPQGHEVEFDDVKQSITITSSTDQTVTIDPQKIELKTSGDTATFTLDKGGQISIQANQGIELKAPSITLDGQQVEIKSKTRTNLNGGQQCSIQASLVKIN